MLTGCCSRAAGATLDAATGLLHWQPTAADKELQPVAAPRLRHARRLRDAVVHDRRRRRRPRADARPAGDCTLREGESFTLPIARIRSRGRSPLVRADHLPPGARFDSARGRLRWTPGYADAGEYRDVAFTVTDGTNVVTKLVDLRRRPGNAPPVLRGIPDRTVRQGDPVLFTIHADDVDGQPLTYSLVDRPARRDARPERRASSRGSRVRQRAAYTVASARATARPTAEHRSRSRSSTSTSRRSSTRSRACRCSRTRRSRSSSFAFDADNPHFQPAVRLANGTLSGDPDGPPPTRHLRGRRRSRRARRSTPPPAPSRGRPRSRRPALRPPLHRDRRRRRHRAAADDDADAPDRGAEREPRARRRADRRRHGREGAVLESADHGTDADGDPARRSS